MRATLNDLERTTAAAYPTLVVAAQPVIQSRAQGRELTRVYSETAGGSAPEMSQFWQSLQNFYTANADDDWFARLK